MKRDDVQILPGRNSWLISRTDRDGVSLDGVRSTALVVLRHWLQAASPLGMRSVFAEQGDRYVIGAARGVSLDITSERPEPLAPRATLQRFEDCRHVRVLNARDPWWLSLRFSWHAGAVRRPWPRFSVNAIGVEDDNDQSLDWLLLEAVSDAAQLGKVG